MRRKLGEILVTAGLLSQRQLDEALAVQACDANRRKLGELVIALNLTSEDRLLQALSSALRYPVADLRVEWPNPKALALVSFEEAQRSLVLPLRVEARGSQNGLVLAMADPTNLEVIDLIQFRLGMTVVPKLALISQLRGAIIDHYRGFTGDAEPDTAAVEAQPDHLGEEATWIEPPPAATDVAELRIVVGPGRGRLIRLSRTSTLVFGRSPDVDVVVSDLRLSRRHFAVCDKDGAIELVDLKSQNGTMISGRRIDRDLLKNGDRVEAGATAVLVHMI